jgi:hypothetical protein
MHKTSTNSNMQEKQIMLFVSSIIITSHEYDKILHPLEAKKTYLLAKNTCNKKQHFSFNLQKNFKTNENTYILTLRGKFMKPHIS